MGTTTWGSWLADGAQDISLSKFAAEPTDLMNTAPGEFEENLKCCI